MTAQSLVRYKTNDYSDRVAYGHQDVLVRGYVDEVVIAAAARSSLVIPEAGSGKTSSSIPALPAAARAEDQCAGSGCTYPGRDLPEEFATLRRLMEGRMAKHGRRGYVQVLRLLESIELADLHAAVKQVLQLGAIGFDAVKHLSLLRVGGAPAAAIGPVHLYLPRPTVETTSARAYMRLLRMGRKRHE